MKKIRKSPLLITFFILLLSIVCICLPVFAAEGADEGEGLYDGYIVKLTDNAPVSVSLLAADGVSEVADGYFVAESLEAAQNIADDRYIEYIEPNYYLTLFADPNDTYYATYQDAYMDLIDANAAWGEGGYDGDGVTVAVIDSGIVSGHQDLEYTNILEGTYYYLDGTTVREDTDYDAVTDTDGHGSFVTGIIAAQTNNALGIAGMMDEVDILPLRCFVGGGSSLAQILAALQGAINADVDVINMSFGIYQDIQSLEALLETAADDGIILVAAAGNNEFLGYCYPASYDCVISVGSVNSSGLISSFSQKNDKVLVTAPGENIMSLGYKSSEPYRYPDPDNVGTSYAAPFVTAMAAMAKEYDDDIDVYDMMTFLEDSAVDAGDVGKDNSYGYGIINVADFITELEASHGINYNLNGGSLDADAVSLFMTDQTPITLPIPTRSGYDFDGWYTNAGFTGSAVTEVPAGTVADYGVYARWYDKAETRVSDITVCGYAASLEDGTETTYQVLLPADTAVTANDIEIMTEDDSADVSMPVTSDAGATWTFVITSDPNPAYQKTYTINVTISTDHAPAAVSVPQSGEATPASSDTLVPVVPYSEDISTWFSDADEEDTLTYSIVSHNATGMVALDGSTLTFTPAEDDAGKSITLVVKANDGTFDSGLVTLTVTVGSLPGSNSVLSSTSASFDLNEASVGHTDVSVTLTLYENSLVSIKNGLTNLVVDQDYTVLSGTDVTIKKEYLAGLNTGQTTLIFVFDEGNNASLTITMSDSTIKVTNITLSSTSVTVGSSLTLSGTVSPADASNKTIVWSLKNAGVTGALINGNTFTATAAGTATVTATIANGSGPGADYSKDFSITVKEAAAAGGGGGGGAGIDETTYVELLLGGKSVEVPYIMSGNHINLDIDATSLRKLLRNTVTDSTITMDFSSLEGAEVLTIPNAAFKVLQDTAEGGFTLKLPDAQISISAEAMAAVVEEANGGDITISAGLVNASTLTAAQKAAVGDAPVYDLSIKYGSTAMTDLGGNVTISLDYALKDGEKADGIVIWYLDSKGNLTAVPATYDQNTGMVTFTVTHFSYYVIAYDATKVWQNPYSDVAEGAWYYDAVKYCSQNGITNGLQDNLFAPDAGLTRGQFMVLVMRAYGLEAEEAPTDNFADAGNCYYTGYLAAAKSLGIAGGIGDNKFAPESKITRQEMFTLLYRVLGMLDKLPQTDTGATLADYTDADGIAAFAKDAMNALVANGVITGNDGCLDPQRFSTRAQMTQVLYNLLSE